MKHPDFKTRRSVKPMVFLAALTLSLLVICFGFYPTYAWQKDAGTAQNNLKAGVIAVELGEDAFTSGAGITAGEVYGDDQNRKQIDIISSGTLPGVVRVMVLPVIGGDEENLLLDTSGVSLVDLNPAWINGGDGYYYYTQVLTPGETVNFCQNIALDTVDADYDGFTLTVEVLSEATYITPGAYPHEQAWWGAGTAALPQPLQDIQSTLQAAIDTYAWN